MPRIPAALCTVTLLIVASPGQSRLIVDATGQKGKYKTITAAITAAKTGDEILVYPGTYSGLLDLNSKAISLIGATGKASDVVVTVPQDTQPALRIRNHPTGSVSRVDSLSVMLPTPSVFFWGHQEAIQVTNGSGSVLFHNVLANQAVRITGLQGTLVLTSCVLRASYSNFGGKTFVGRIANTKQAFVHGCTFDANFTHNLAQSANTLEVSSTVLEMTQTSVLGSAGAIAGIYSANGSTALALTNSRARISGCATDRIRGGDGANHASTIGGAGVLLTSSSLGWSGVTIQGGPGSRASGPAISGTGATRAKPVIALVSPRARFAVGRQTAVDLQARPWSVSLTWLSLDLAPFDTALGILALDLSKPHFAAWHNHDPKGLATLNLDLRGAPAAVAGLHFGIQTLAASPKRAFVLSSPWIGVVGR